MVQAGKEAAFGIQSIHNPASDFTPRGDGKWWRSLREGTAAPRGAVGCCGREAILPPASSPQSRPTSNQRRRGAVDRPPIPHPETSPLAPAGSIPEVRGAARTTGRNRASLPPHAAGAPPTARATPQRPPSLRRPSSSYLLCPECLCVNSGEKCGLLKSEGSVFPPLLLSCAFSFLIFTGWWTAAWHR